MTFTKLYEFCEAFVQSAVTMITPLLKFFAMEISDYLDFVRGLTPTAFRPVLDGFRMIVDFAGIGGIPMISFLFGGAILFYLAYTFIKWIVDIVL